MLSIEQIKIDGVMPHPQNVRQGDVGAISESLKVHGQYRPIVIQKSTNYIIAGNHTWKAAKSLGWKEIAITFIDVDDEQALRILLMDNRSNDLATYDDSGLIELLTQLASTPESLEGTGFDGDDLDQLIRFEQSISEGSLSAIDEWQGMPEFEQGDRKSAFRVIIHFPTDQDADTFFKRIERAKKANMWWPNSDGWVGSTRTEQYVADE